MKIATIAILCLLCASAEASVNVGKIVPRECSELLRVVVTIDGKPVKDAVVSLYEGYASDGQQGATTVLTRADGVASMPRLAPGKYHADVSFSGIRSEIFDQPVAANVFLHVAPTIDLSTISVELGNSVRRLWEANSALETQLREVLYSPNRYRLKKFQQIIVDPTGAKVASAQVWIVQEDRLSWVVLFKGMPDSNGQVVAELRPGRYITVSSSPGFRTAMASFEITQDGSGELKTVLQLAPATQ